MWIVYEHMDTFIVADKLQWRFIDDNKKVRRVGKRKSMGWKCFF